MNIYKQTDRRQIHSEREIDRYSLIGIQIEIYIRRKKYTYRQTDRQIYKQMHREEERETSLCKCYRQTFIHHNCSGWRTRGHDVIRSCSHPRISTERLVYCRASVGCNFTASQPQQTPYSWHESHHSRRSATAPRATLEACCPTIKQRRTPLKHDIESNIIRQNITAQRPRDNITSSSRPH